MCAIIGFKGKYDQDLLTRVFDNSRIRGLHAFGFSYIDKGEFGGRIWWNYESFVKDIHAKAPSEFIAHFRYATSGDYLQPENNQPLYDSGVAIAFNGVISQKSKAAMEKEFALRLRAENDGYVLLQKYTDDQFTSSPNITFAMVGLDKDGLFALKNNKRPLWYTKNDDFVLLASTRDIMERSGIQYPTQIDNLRITRW